MVLAPVAQRLGCAIQKLNLLAISFSFGGSVQEADYQHHLHNHLYFH